MSGSTLGSKKGGPGNSRRTETDLVYRRDVEPRSTAKSPSTCRHYERFVSRSCRTCNIDIFGSHLCAHIVHYPVLFILQRPSIPHAPWSQPHSYPLGYPISLESSCPTLRVKLNFITTPSPLSSFGLSLSPCSLVVIDFWNIIVGRTSLRSSVYILYSTFPLSHPVSVNDLSRCYSRFTPEIPARTISLYVQSCFLTVPQS